MQLTSDARKIGHVDNPINEAILDGTIPPLQFNNMTDEQKAKLSELIDKHMPKHSFEEIFGFINDIPMVPQVPINATLLSEDSTLQDKIIEHVRDLNTEMLEQTNYKDAVPLNIPFIPGTGCLEIFPMNEVIVNNPWTSRDPKHMDIDVAATYPRPDDLDSSNNMEYLRVDSMANAKNMSVKDAWEPSEVIEPSVIEVSAECVRWGYTTPLDVDSNLSKLGVQMAMTHIQNTVEDAWVKSIDAEQERRKLDIIIDHGHFAGDHYGFVPDWDKFVNETPCTEHSRIPISELGLSDTELEYIDASLRDASHNPLVSLHTEAEGSCGNDGRKVVIIGGGRPAGKTAMLASMLAATGIQVHEDGSLHASRNNTPLRKIDTPILKATEMKMTPSYLALSKKHQTASPYAHGKRPREESFGEEMRKEYRSSQDKRNAKQGYGKRLTKADKLKLAQDK